MGLDMYLYAEKYESRSTYKFKDNEEELEKCVNEFYPEDLHEIGIKHAKHNFLSKQTKHQIGYWRKFNALHKYFEKKVDAPHELCRGIELFENTIRDLISKFEAILKDVENCEIEEKQYCCGWRGGQDLYDTKKVYNSKVALDLLPPGDGFFFGSQDIDEWYIEDIKYSLELFKSALELLDKGYSIIYDASW